MKASKSSTTAGFAICRVFLPRYHIYNRAPGKRREGCLRRLTISREFQLFPCQNTSRVACVLRKCQGVRAMNRIQVLVSSATFVVSHRVCNTRASRVYTTIECARVHVYAHTHSFRGTEFIFLEKIRKGIPSPFFHLHLPFLCWHSLSSLLTATPACIPVIPRDFPENDMSGNEAEICSRIERWTLIQYRRVNNLSYCTTRCERAKRVSMKISGHLARERRRTTVEIYRPIVASKTLEDLAAGGLFCDRSSGLFYSLLGNGRIVAKIIFMEQYRGSSARRVEMVE